MRRSSAPEDIQRAASLLLDQLVALRAKIPLLEEDLRKRNPLFLKKEHHEAAVRSRDLSRDFDLHPTFEVNAPANFGAELWNTVVGYLISKASLGTFDDFVRGASHFEHRALSERILDAIVGSARL